MQKNININLNKNIRDLHLEELGDTTMNTFSRLVGKALYLQSQGSSWRTDNNTKIETGKTWYTSKNEIPNLIKLLEENPSYFKDFNIVSVTILSDEEQERRIRKNFHINEMSTDYIYNHVPNLDDIIAERELKKPRIYRNEKTGEYLDPGSVKKEIES